MRIMIEQNRANDESKVMVEFNNIMFLNLYFLHGAELKPKAVPIRCHAVGRPIIFNEISSDRQWLSFSAMKGVS